MQVTTVLLSVSHLCSQFDKTCDVYVEANERTLRETAGGGDGDEGSAVIKDHAGGSGSSEGCRGEHALCRSVARHRPKRPRFPHPK